jgi:hypothetical protein
MLSTTLRNAMLNTLDNATFLSIHSSYSPFGSNEIVGGSPAYARKAPVWSAANSGSKSISAPVIFDMPASSTAAWVGLWSAVTGGTFYGMVPVDVASSSLPEPFIVDDASPDTLKSVAHGLAMDTGIVVWNGTQTLPNSTPANLAEGNIIYAQPTSVDAFQVALTPAGTPMDITSQGAGYWQRITTQAFASQGVFTLSGLSFSLPGV